MGATRLEAAEKTDAGRVAPISACVFYQIDRLKSGFEAMGRTVMPGNCALMGARRVSRRAFFSSLVSRSGSRKGRKIRTLLNKIACTSAVQNEKKYSFILHCIRFALSFNKIGCTSAV